MYPFYLELELVKPVCDYLKKDGYKINREIKIGFCIADIVAYKDDHVIAVELKLNDWKKALQQARNYQLGADFVYIAIPLMKSYNVLRKAEYIFEREGIGLLIINEKTTKVNKIINAKKSKKKIGTTSIYDKSIKRKNKSCFY